MTSILNNILDEKVLSDSETFLNQIKSDISYNAATDSNDLSFDWVEVVEQACPYLDNIVRNPKLMLITEENIEKIEKTKKVTVETVKDLSKHTFYIDDIDDRGDVKPSKLLDIRGIDTFNTYENRVIFTLLHKLRSFVSKKVEELDNFEMDKNKTLEYAADTNTDFENISIELKLVSKTNKDGDGDALSQQIEQMRPRIKKITNYISLWHKSDFVKVLTKERAPFVIPPISKTNVILKNPNFQVAMKLWSYLSEHTDTPSNQEGDEKATFDTDILKKIINNFFLTNYLLVDVIDTDIEKQKAKLLSNAGVIINQQIKTIVSLLISSGIEITDKELLMMVAVAIKEEKKYELMGCEGVKDTFLTAMNEYIEKMQENL